jgi:hypothetical protein
MTGKIYIGKISDNFRKKWAAIGGGCPSKKGFTTLASWG